MGGGHFFFPEDRTGIFYSFFLTKAMSSVIPIILFSYPLPTHSSGELITGLFLFFKRNYITIIYKYINISNVYTSRMKATELQTSRWDSKNTAWKEG